MSLNTRVIAITIFCSIILSGCTAAKTVGKVATLPVKGVYQAGKLTGKAVMWTGKGFVKSGETVINVTNAALDTTSRLLNVTSQVISVSGQVVTVTEQISRAELEATLEAARQSTDVISVLVDVAT